jgi:hypothetical protein
VKMTLIDMASTTPALTTCASHAAPSMQPAETRPAAWGAERVTSNGAGFGRGVVRLAPAPVGVKGRSVSVDRDRKVQPGNLQPTGANGLRYIPFGVGIVSGDPPRGSDFA